MTLQKHATRTVIGLAAAVVTISGLASAASVNPKARFLEVANASDEKIEIELHRGKHSSSITLSVQPRETRRFIDVRWGTLGVAEASVYVGERGQSLSTQFHSLYDKAYLRGKLLTIDESGQAKLTSVGLFHGQWLITYRHSSSEQTFRLDLEHRLEGLGKFKGKYTTPEGNAKLTVTGSLNEQSGEMELDLEMPDCLDLDWTFTVSADGSWVGRTEVSFPDFGSSDDDACKDGTASARAEVDFEGKTIVITDLPD